MIALKPAWLLTTTLALSFAPVAFADTTTPSSTQVAPNGTKTTTTTHENGAVTTTTTSPPAGAAVTTPSKKKKKAPKKSVKSAQTETKPDASVAERESLRDANDKLGRSNDSLSRSADQLAQQNAELANQNRIMEERARAAEQFRAEEAQIETQHQAELEKVRNEEHAAAEKDADAKVAQARADEAALAEKRIADADKGKAIKDAALTPVGLYGYVGGGAGGFTQPTAVGQTSVGGYWDARLGIGSRSILGAEVAYVGGSRDIRALGLNSSASLMNNGVEGVARLNVPITPRDTSVLIEPYTFGGIGWSRYDLVNAGNNTSSVQNQDDIMTVPMGIGLQLGFSAFSLDVRGTYRQAIGSNLLGTSTSSFDNASLNSWGAGAALGFEF
jgi:hypothetical protein